MDIAEDELLETFRDTVDGTCPPQTDEELEYPGNVQILYGDDQMPVIQKMFEDVLEELKIPGESLRPALRQTLLNDILMIHGTKKEMLQEYYDMVQRPYHTDPSDPPEVDLKDIIVTLVPEVIRLRIGHTDADSTADCSNGSR